MTEAQSDPPQSSSDERIFEADPTLGEYVSHHPSDRVRLLIQGVLLYTPPVLILQILFWNVDDRIAGIFLPVLFAATGIAVMWYIAHLWNREVVIYERGFSFRQGSNTAYFLFMQIVKLQPHIETVKIGAFSRTLYDYRLTTDMNEKIRIYNLYSRIEMLTRRIEKGVVRDRLPLLRQRLTAGESVALGAGLSVSREGLHHDGRELFWHEMGGHAVRGGQVIIRQRDEAQWAVFPVAELDNPLLVVALLKALRPASA